MLCRKAIKVTGLTLVSLAALMLLVFFIFTKEINYQSMFGGTYYEIAVSDMAAAEIDINLIDESLILSVDIDKMPAFSVVKQVPIGLNCSNVSSKTTFCADLSNIVFRGGGTAYWLFGMRVRFIESKSSITKRFLCFPSVNQRDVPTVSDDTDIHRYIYDLSDLSRFVFDNSKCNELCHARIVIRNTTYIAIDLGSGSATRRGGSTSVLRNTETCIDY